MVIRPNDQNEILPLVLEPQRLGPMPLSAFFSSDREIVSQCLPQMILRYGHAYLYLLSRISKHVPPEFQMFFPIRRVYRAR